MIVFDNIGKRYGPAGRDSATVALVNVTLNIPAGRVTAVVGPNGAGKSTLLGLVLGFIRQTSGSLTVAGSNPGAWVRRNGAGYLPERFAPPPEWRVDRSLRAFARLEGLGRVEAAETAARSLGRFGLSPHATKNVGALSRGLLQRMGLAQAMLVRRELVVLDEPTESLDPPGRALFRETVTGLRDDGCTVLIASHDLAELERVADRAVVLDAGRLRESFELRGAASGDLRAWVVSLAAPLQSMFEIFPGAVVLGSAPPAAEPAMPSVTTAEAVTDARPAVRYAVTTRDARDLTSRLAAIIAAGAIIRGVAPDSLSLEDRLRHALERQEAAGPGTGGAPTTPTRGSAGLP